MAVSNHLEVYQLQILDNVIVKFTKRWYRTIISRVTFYSENICCMPCMYACIYLCVCIYIYIYACMYICMYVCVYMYVYHSFPYENTVIVTKSSHQDRGPWYLHLPNFTTTYTLLFCKNIMQNIPSVK